MKSTLTQFIAGAFGLIGVYLVLANSSGFAKDITSGATGASQVFSTLQGRSS